MSSTPSVTAPVEVQTVKPNETLLYGAMTKYELMTFVKAIQNANLQTALESNDPMTIFAPDNFAFEYANLPDQTDLGTLLKGHVVSGVLTWENLYDAVIASNAPLTLDTLAGTQLTVYLMDDKLKIAGSDGQLATVSQADMIQTNGIMHQINTVLQP